MEADPYENLRHLLIHGQLVPGAKLNESDWIKRLGTSRIALREAVSLLVHEGLLRRGERSGFYVPVPDQRDLDEVMEIRAIIEAGAIRLLASRRPEPGELSPLVQMCDLMQANLNSNMDFGFAEADRAFHRHLVQLSKNQRLMDLYDRAPLPLGPFRIVDPAARQRAGQETIAEHRRLCKLIGQRKIDEAVSALEQHLRAAGREPLPYKKT